MKKCEVCTENPSKYCCPGCELRTCCLTCVQKHKVNTGCTGQRDKTAYVAIKSFTDINLLSDYRFLEDAGRKNNNASRDNLKRQHMKPNFLKELEKQAGRRKIDLRTMPYPMSRRKNNYTTYHYKTKEILWQIEWLFPSMNLTLKDKRIPDSASLESVLDAHFSDDADPIIKHKLRRYILAGKPRWGLFMKVENCAQNRYHRLDIAQSVMENLKNKCVIEYPTIHVVLEENWAQYPTDASENEREMQDSAIVHTEEVSVTESSSSTSTSTSYADSRVADEVPGTEPGQLQVPSRDASQLEVPATDQGQHEVPSTDLGHANNFPAQNGTKDSMGQLDKETELNGTLLNTDEITENTNIVS